ncbi:Tyrosine-protein kinase Src42A [Eumeta japonica]|uniref:Tyrosine-protein kinase Src42A n=1 Tax=Eumeta variegata TaxID=151549 RepID=A0A4C1UBF9_EUMVA|nr:Tyrosine-protein kinase Src42A [Eumeta japonica]
MPSIPLALQMKENAVLKPAEKFTVYCLNVGDKATNINICYPGAALEWYFRKIKRIEAEKKLLLPENEHGAFLIRDSQSRHNDFSLSAQNWMAWEQRGLINDLSASPLQLRRLIISPDSLTFVE